MAVSCVRVAREDGERTRRCLDDAGLLDRDYQIVEEDGWLYIPVVSPETVPDRMEVVEREVGVRETQQMPTDLLEEEPSYERLGDIVILHEDDRDRATEIAEAIMASDLRAKTVVNRASEIRGVERIRQWDVVAGNGTETVHREFGCEFALDVGTVYFSPRLATERHRVVEQVRQEERVFDMFAGVGPFVIPMAKRGAECIAVDINEAAIEYLRENVARNDVEERVTTVHGDVREVTGEYVDWADRVLMNLPHSADEFIETAVQLAGEECVLHFYDIQPVEDPFQAGEMAIREAASPTYEVAIETRRVVRSYSPLEVNVCLDVRLNRR